MYRKVLTFDTTRKTEFRTITPEPRACIAEAGLESGAAVAYSLQTTQGLGIQETSEPNLREDIADFLEAAVASDGSRYKHRHALPPRDACAEDRLNAPSHARQCLTYPPIVLDRHGGDLSLGRWQDLSLAEQDGPRKGRQILVKILPDRG
jgi:secondary thiamine-phosphate synthase enzyme